MRPAETILTWCAGVACLAAMLLIPYSAQVEDRPRRQWVLPGSMGRFEADEHPLTGVKPRGGFGGREEMTVIRPEFPKPLCIGDVMSMLDRPPNLVRGGFSIQSEATVPRSVSLVSRGAVVTSSDPAPLGELTLLTDGEKNGDDGYFVDLLPLKQWVQLDLGESREIWLLWIWMFHKQFVMYNDVFIEVSDDPEFKKAHVVFNNDHDDTSGRGIGADEAWVDTNRGHAIQAHGVRGRYVRLWSNGRNIDDTNQWIEVEVYGR